MLIIVGRASGKAELKVHVDYPSSMSEEVSTSNIAGSFSLEVPGGDCVRDSTCSDGETASELFDSFMEIVNDPKHQENDDELVNGTFDQARKVGGTVDQSDKVDGTLDQAGEERGMVDQTCVLHGIDQIDKVNRRVDQFVEQHGIVDQFGEGHETVDQSNALFGPSDQDKEPDMVSEIPESTPVKEKVGDIVSDVTDEHKTAMNSSGTTELDSQSINQVSPEYKSEQSIEDDKKESKIQATDSNLNPDLAEDLARGENKSDDENRKSDEGLNLPSTVAETNDFVINSLDNKSLEEEQLPKESGEFKDDADSLQTETAKRFSKAMEDLEGLERELGKAVVQFQRSNSIKDKEISEQKGEDSGLKKSYVEQDKPDRLADNNKMSLQKADENVNMENAVDQEEKLSDASLMTNTPVISDHEKCEEPPARTESLVKSTEDKDLSQYTCTAPSDTGEAQKNQDDKKPRGTQVLGVDTSQEENVEQSKSGNEPQQISDLSASTEDNNSVGESIAKNVSSSQQMVVYALPDKEETSVGKSNSEDELDLEVTNACTSIPEIEIVTTDESGISERKSIDSLDTEESSNSRAASPAFSDEGVDSDVQSDYGDYDEDTTFTGEGTESSRSKSWLLEIDRNRLSSDSSTVSELEFKEKFSMGDNADGNHAKERIRGHLLKMGGTGLTPKNWRKRWFVLRDDKCLYYYKQSRDKEPCGVIVLCNYSVSKAPEVSKRFCLKLTKGGARTYYMCAGSEDDMRQWMVALMEAVKETAQESNPFQISEGNLHNVSIPALAIRDPDCHGYLYKKGHNIKMWRRRYCVLKNGVLYYYSDMSNTVALGVAKLLGYAICEGDQNGKKFCFSAISPETSSRTYFFAAESDMDRKRWLAHLEDSIKKGSIFSRSQTH